MLFNSFAFLAFFAIVVLLYYAVPHRWRWLLLLVASYYFYSAFQTKYVLLLAFSTSSHTASDLPCLRLAAES